MNTITQVTRHMAVYIGIGMILWGGTAMPAMQMSMQSILNSAYRPLMQRALTHVGPLALGGLLGTAIYAYQYSQAWTAWGELQKKLDGLRKQESNLEQQKYNIMIRRSLLSQTQEEGRLTCGNLGKHVTFCNPSDKQFQRWFEKVKKEYMTENIKGYSNNYIDCYLEFNGNYIVSSELRSNAHGIDISLRGSALRDMQMRLTEDQPITDRNGLHTSLHGLPKIVVDELLTNYQRAREARNLPELDKVKQDLEVVTQQISALYQSPPAFHAMSCLKYSAFGTATVYGVAQLLSRMRA